MRTLILAVIAALAIPAAAEADVILPFVGDCPPGARLGIASHAEACIPQTCTEDVDCDDGAFCQTLCTCMAEREVRDNGRLVLPEPMLVVMEVGLCDAAGECAEGTVSQRRQCEPVEQTPAFDRSSHRWTGEPHPQSSCLGCATSSQRGGVGALLAVMLVLFTGICRRGVGRRAHTSGALTAPRA